MLFEFDFSSITVLLEFDGDSDESFQLHFPYLPDTVRSLKKTIRLKSGGTLIILSQYFSLWPMDRTI
jgi:hypothetical protein